MAGPKARLHLPYGEWPQADRLLWERAMRDDDPFATGAHLAAASKHNCLFAWRRFLGFLVTDDPTAVKIPPNERLRADRVRAFRAHLARTNTPRSVADYIDALYHAARVMMPESDWSWLKAMKAQLYRHAPCSRARGCVITSVQLLDAGEQLMEESKSPPDARIGTRDALKFRDGLMAAIAGCIPIRRKNLAALEVGHHLVREDDRWLVVIPAEESKTKTSMTYVVPEFLEPYLAYYLDVVRPMLLRNPTCPALWVSSKGGAICYGAIGHIFSSRLSSLLGFRVTLHDARDAAITMWALFVPDQIDVASALLGHRDPSTRELYNRARGIEASRAYRKVIARIRRKTKRRGHS